MYCIRCGKELTGGENFCPYCGTKQEPHLEHQGEPADPQSEERAGEKGYGLKRLWRRKKRLPNSAGKPRWKRWLKRIGIGLGAVVGGLVLLLIIDHGMSSRKAEIPDPALFFQLDWRDSDSYWGGYDDYFDGTAPSDLAVEAVWEAMEAYARLLEQSGADVALDDRSGTNGNDCYCLEADFGRTSVFDSRHRKIQLDYYLPEGRFFYDTAPLFDGWIHFIHIDAYSADTDSSSTTGAGDTRNDAGEAVTSGESENPMASDGASSLSADSTQSAPEGAGQTAGIAAPVITDTAVPDFQAFCNNRLYLFGATEYSDYTEYVYFWKYNGKAMDEYLALLQDTFHFELRAESVTSSINSYRYSFDYTGAGSAGTYDEDGMDGSDGQGIALYIWDLHASPIEGEIHICVADGFDYMDTGDRTTREITPYQEESAAVTASDGEQDCWNCNGSGDCPDCGGTGTVTNWLPGTNEYVEQDCTACASPGKCRVCGGSGKV